MPTWTHLPVLALLVVAIFLPPPVPEPPLPSPDEVRGRAVRAMTELTRAAGSMPCDAERLQEIIERAPEKFGEPGFRRHGWLVGWRVRPMVGDASPDDPAGHRPGTLLLRCRTEGFQLSAVVLDRLPEGRPFVLRDGVGRPLVVNGPGPTPVGPP